MNSRGPATAAAAATTAAVALAETGSWASPREKAHVMCTYRSSCTSGLYIGLPGVHDRHLAVGAERASQTTQCKAVRGSGRRLACASRSSCPIICGWHLESWRGGVWAGVVQRGDVRISFVVHTRLWEALIYAGRVCTTDACWGRAGEPDETMRSGAGLLGAMGGGWPTGGGPHAQSGTSNGSSNSGGGIGGNKELG